jgi:NADPH:quinone reductase-like Zn-dependent oxidoreductase
MPEPKAGEVRVKVVAAAVNPLDWKLLRGDMLIFRPLLTTLHIGCDFAGVVDAVAPDVTAWRSGDEVLGSLKPLPGTTGTMQEFLALPAGDIVRKPHALSFAEAAALPISGCSALNCLRLAGVGSAQRTLIIGAAGGVGSFCVQIARLWGAHITAVCSAANAERVKSLGADVVVPYDREDVQDRNETYDAIVDTVGSGGFSRWSPRLHENGRYVNTLPGAGDYLATWRSKLFGGKQARALMVKVTAAQLTELIDLVHSARIRPLLAEHYPLARTREAFEHAITGKANGKIIVDVATAATVSSPDAIAADRSTVS